MAGKLWDKGFEPDTMIEEYTVGQDRELDLRLARYDVEGSLAHIATFCILIQYPFEPLTDCSIIIFIQVGKRSTYAPFRSVKAAAVQKH